ncbi:MAG: MopE-related protein [Nitrospirota bacterium]
MSWDAPTTNADGTPLTDLDGYKVYYGTASGNYSEVVNVGRVTSHTINNLTNGATYYFAATAYDIAGNESEYSNEVTLYPDADNDGYTSDVDCNDNNPAVNPGATEVCDGIDNNCNEAIDEGVLNIYYKDADSDGYGDLNNSTQACTQPSGYVTNNTDCDDSDPNEHPGQTWYKDADNDKYSDGTKNTTSCTRPTGYKVVSELIALSGDCNESDASINPGTTEVCNGKDDNCNGQIDENACFILSCSDAGIQCLERTDAVDESDNLVSGKPKVNVEYEFIIIVTDIGSTPQYVRLFMTQRNNPFAGDFYGYDMFCSGDYSTGATCTYTTKLGPAAVHKFYFEAKMSNGTTIRYPETGYITGPEVQLLKGYNLAGVPRDISTANLDGEGAFGSASTYRWNADLGYYTKVTTSEPVKVGEGYFTFKESTTLPELADYGEVQVSEYTYQLKSGWNIISNPYAGNIKLSDIKVQKGSDTPVSWQEAIDNGWIVNAIYYYNGEDWGRAYSFETADDGATLVPWMGYWIYLNKEDDTYKLVIPKP